MRDHRDQPPPFSGGGPRNGPAGSAGFTGRDEAQRGRDDPFRSPNQHRLYRNRRAGRVAGVCAGIADYLNVDAWIVRLAVIIGSLFFFPLVPIAYVVLTLFLKVRPSELNENTAEEQFWRSVATRPDQTLAGLKTKFRDLDRQLAGMEGFVASREFDLHRQFRDLEQK